MLKHHFLKCILCFCSLITLPQLVVAQIPPRFIINGSFEEVIDATGNLLPTSGFGVSYCTKGGSGGPPTTRAYVGAAVQVPGVNPTLRIQSWESTDTDTSNNFFDCKDLLPPNIIFRPFQLFNNDDTLTDDTPFGNMYAELNPEHQTRMHQPICTIAGENIAYTFYHGWRVASPPIQQARALLCPPNAGFPGAGCINGVISTRLTFGFAPVTGIFVSPVTGEREFSFESVAPNSSAGNLIDNVSVELSPFAGYGAAITPASVGENGTFNITLLVNGTLPATSQIIMRRAASSIAKPIVDYTFNTISAGGRSGLSAALNTAGDIVIDLPAGIYDPNTSVGAKPGLIVLTFNTVDDSVVEASEFLQFNMSNADTIGGTALMPFRHILSGMGAGCTTALSNQSVTIIDNDQPTLTKAFGAASILSGQATTLTFSINNPADTSPASTDRIAVAPVSFTDNLPANLRVADNLVTLNNCISTSTPTVSAGDTSFTVTAANNLGVSNAPTPNAVACTITINVTNFNAQTNTDCAANPAAFTNGNTAVTGVTNATNNVTNQCLIVNPHANIRISKTDAKTASGIGELNSYTITVANAGPNAADNSVVSDNPSTGLTCPGALGSANVNCVPSGGASCPTGSPVSISTFNSGVAIPLLPSGGSVVFVYQCTSN